MKNSKRIGTSQPEQDGTFDGGSIALIMFAAAAIWLLLFQSNIFN